MKRSYLAIAALLVLLPFTAAHAETKKAYELPDAALSIQLPQSQNVITRSTKDGDAALAKKSYDAQTMLFEFEKDSIYLEAFDNNKKYSIFIIKRADSASRSYFDMRKMKDQYAAQTVKNHGTADEYMNYFGKAESENRNKNNPKIIYAFLSAIAHPQAIFLRETYEADNMFGVNIPGKKVYGAHDYTYINGSVIDIHLFTYGEKPSNEQLALLDDARASVVFQKVDYIPPTPTPARPPATPAPSKTPAPAAAKTASPSAKVTAPPAQASASEPQISPLVFVAIVVAIAALLVFLAPFIIGRLLSKGQKEDE